MVASHLRRHSSTLALGVAYLVLACAAIGLTRFHGGVAFISIANAVLLARLLTSRPRRWLAPAVACAVASAIATSLVGLGTGAALPMALVNVGEALIGAIALARLSPHARGLGSRATLPAFLAVAGLLAPAASAFGGAAVATWFGGDTYGANWVNWYAGHALGLVTFTPVATYLMRGDARRWFAAASRMQVLEFAAHIALVAAVTAATFSQATRPVLFLPMLPVILATFRNGRIAAAFAVVVVAVIGGGLTIAGLGPIGAAAAPVAERIQFLQFYLACTVVTVLPIAAELARRSVLYARLHDSEARYRLLTENSTDIVLNLDVHGRIRFASPSIRQIGGYGPEEVIGRNARDLVDPADVPAVAAAHAAALRDPSRTVTVEYRAAVADGATRWFETHTRAILDEAGAVVGVVSAVRDVGHRKSLEERLSAAATTDQLTGAANRRAFGSRLAAAVASADAGAAGGCVALFDLDHFKRVNDRFGHAGGDAVLRRFVEICRSRLRGDDLVARHGGEEFAILLPGASPHQAQLVCDRIRRAVGESATEFEDRVIRVTASGGVAGYGAGDDPAAVVAAADRALYRAKEAGRNRLALAA